MCRRAKESGCDKESVLLVASNSASAFCGFAESCLGVSVTSIGRNYGRARANQVKVRSITAPALFHPEVSRKQVRSFNPPGLRRRSETALGVKIGEFCRTG